MGCSAGSEVPEGRENQDVPGPTLQVRGLEGALLQPSLETDGGSIRAPRKAREPHPPILKKSSGAERGGALGSLGLGLEAAARAVARHCESECLFDSSPQPHLCPAPGRTPLPITPVPPVMLCFPDYTDSETKATELAVREN